MSLARAELLYEQYKGRTIHDPIVFRLVLLIHLRKKREKLMEFEMQALAHTTEQNKDAMRGQVETYRRLLFPGVPEPRDEWVEQAKKLLAEETKKVYIVKPYGEGAERTLRNAAMSKNEALRDWARHEMHVREVQRKSLQERGASRRTPRPRSR